MTHSSQTHRRPARQAGFALPGGLMPLVDILLATLGVFIVVLASQELVDDIPTYEVPAEAVLVCHSAQEVSLVWDNPDRAALSLTPKALSTTLPQEMPLGGNLVVAIPDACTHGSPSGFQQLLALDTAMTTTSAENIFFRFRFVPVGDADYSAEVLVAAFQGQNSWPPVKQAQ